MIKIAGVFYKRLAEKFPSLDLKLRQAKMMEMPDEFVRKTFVSAIYMSLGLFFFFFAVLGKLGVSMIFIMSLLPISFIMVFFYLMRAPDVYILKKRKGITREIVFVGRFLIIELQSGVSLYDAFVNISKSYPVVGEYCIEIVNKVNMGIMLEDALNEAIELSPSPDFRKLLWQIVNALRTGADVAGALDSVIEQIVREQRIMINEYGKKLNPIAMFYMMMAIILPTLGMIMFIILATFMGLEIGLSGLLSLAGFMGFIQFMFVTIIKSSRPPVEM